jgi:RNA polymerase subunit RPABC4/transcription elongation factor Spt4
MAASTGKTVALIFIIFLLVILVVGMPPLLLPPLFMLPRMAHQIFSGAHLIHFGEFRPFLFLPGSLGLFFFVLWLVVVFWVYSDAEKRNMSGILWALLVFVGNIVGLIIYLLVRSVNTSMPISQTVPKIQATCPQCKKTVQTDFKVCPHCGASLRIKCKSCSKELSPDWKVCPYCGEKV